MAFLDQLRTVLDKKIKINAEFIFLLQGLLFMKSLQKLRKSPPWGVRISSLKVRLHIQSLCVGAEYGSQGVQLFGRCTPRALGRVGAGAVLLGQNHVSAAVA